MLKKILLGVGAVVLLFVLYVVYALFIATPKSPPNTATYEGSGLEIEIEYSQPSKRGRLIFGDAADEALQPYGKYWRLGANSATEIRVNKDVSFGGKPLKAGSYRIYAVPGPESFKVTLNSELDVFFGVSEPDPALDLFSVDAPVTMQSTETEMFTVNIKGNGSGAQIDFIWDKTLFSVPITVQ
jgi:hypothetical protein